MSGTATAFLQGVSRFQSKANGHRPGWLKTLRRSAFECVSEHGFPTGKDEAWKYTRVAPHPGHPFRAGRAGLALCAVPG